MKLSIFSLFLILLTYLSFGQDLNNTSIWKDFTFSEKRLPHFEWNNDGSITFYGNKTVTISTSTGDTLSILHKNPNTITKNNIELIPSNKTYIYRHSFKADYTIINKTDTSLLYKSPQQAVSFSPNGTFISFISNNNLFIYDPVTKKYNQVTKNGKKNHIINGVSDWVHEEEFDFTTAYWWSKDEQYIAYLEFNETNVKTHRLTKLTDENYPETIEYKYPKVGEKNSSIKLIIYNTLNKTHSTICTNTEDEYILNPSWHNNKLYFQTLDRKQQNLKIISYKNNVFDTIYKDKSRTYINNTPIFFHNNSIILQSEKTGYNNIYSLSLNTKKITAITTSRSPISKIYTIKGNDLYYQQKTNNGLDNLVFKLDINDKKIIALSPPIGSYELYISPFSEAHILKQSTVLKAPKYTLVNTEKEHLTVSTLLDNKHLSNYFTTKTSVPELSSITLNDSITLNSYTIYPPNFREKKKHPVLIYVYGGPGYQTVENKWLGTTYSWHQFIASKGYIVISIDPRGTGGKGKVFRECTYEKLGTLESEDIIKAIIKISLQKYIDTDRIGIWGWSYGGYLTTRCLLTNTSPFKMGIAVAPVTDWRFYDNIYTERYMGLNDSTNRGYDKNSCLNKVDQLNANFLLIHGTLDDNVHIQNTYMLQQKLIEHNKEFDSFIYPNKNHGIYGGNTRLHLFNKLTNYIIKNL